MGFTIEGDDGVKNLGVGVEDVPPNSVAQDDGGHGSWSEILGGWRTAEARLNAEDGEEIPANLRAFDGGGGSAPTEDPDAFAVAGHGGEFGGLLAEIVDVGHGDVAVGPTAQFIDAVNADDAIGFGEWRRFQDDRMEHGKYGAIGPNAESEREDCHSGKGRRSQ